MAHIAVTSRSLRLLLLLNLAIIPTGCGRTGDDERQTAAHGARSPDSQNQDEPGDAQEVYQSLVRNAGSSVLVETMRPDEVIAPEDRGLGYVDPATGQVAWWAITCKNPSCKADGSGGRPFLFTFPIPGAKLDAAGNLVLPADDVIEAHARAHLRCPVCGQSEWLQKYDPPEVAERRNALELELAAARRARDVAKSSGTAASEVHRTPAEIMYELSTLPKLYLLPDAGRGK